MTGSYVLSFQVYLALPMTLRDTAPDGTTATVGTAMLFAVSALATILGQTRLTAWCKQRWTVHRSISTGLALMGAAFLPLLVPIPTAGPGRWIAVVAPPVLAGLLLAVATMIVYPFEMDTIVTLAQDRLVATHYGLYNTICGIGITVGNFLTGAALDAARRSGVPALALPYSTRPGLRGRRPSAPSVGPPGPGRRTGACHGNVTAYRPRRCPKGLLTSRSTA